MRFRGKEMTEPGANVVDEGGYTDQLMTVTGKVDG